MFWLMLFFGWKLANTLDEIGDELIAMSEAPEPASEPELIPAEDGLWIRPDDVFGLQHRMN